MDKDITLNSDAFLKSVGIMDLSENCVIVVSDGIAKFCELPVHGKFKVITHQGKVRRMRKEEGEEF